MNKIKIILLWLVAIGLQLFNATGQIVSPSESQGIKIYDKNPWYWQFNGVPVILRGGSDVDNLFQWTGKKLTDHLDLLVSVGGNYVRNTMSDRKDGNVYAFKKTGNNSYDLNQWNEEYWNRLTFFLDETSRRDIVVQLTFWDQFDIGSSQWKNHPWNPVCNTKYETRLPERQERFFFNC